jgi:hypothetical protein
VFNVDVRTNFLNVIFVKNVLQECDNGTVCKGTVSNGAVSNGTVSNGTASNSTVSNGTVSNGTVCNGTVSKRGTVNCVKSRRRKHREVRNVEVRKL